MTISSVVNFAPIFGSFIGHENPVAWRSASADAIEAYGASDTPARTRREAPVPGMDAADSRPSPGNAKSGRGDRVRVVGRGGTLWNIAGNYDVIGATRYQKMAAIFTANPHAFIDNDMSRLKAGARISLPDAQAVLAVNPAEARRLCADQINEYEQKRRGTTPDASRPGQPAQVELKPGDSVVVTFDQTLGGIAKRFRVPNTTLAQKIVAISNANADAFIGNNVNRMKTGVRLVMPDAIDVEALGAGVAQRILNEQWAAYQRSRA